MLGSLSLLLALPLALATDPTDCTQLVPITFDNATVPRLLGQWVYIAGVSRYGPHVEELKMLRHAVFTFAPSSHEDELNVTEIMRLNETCVVRNTSKIHVFWHNSTLAHVEGQAASTAKLMQSNTDLLILKHLNDNVPTLSVSARTANLTKEQTEEFKAHLHCLGFTEEDVISTSEENACPQPEEKTGEGDVEPPPE